MRVLTHLGIGMLVLGVLLIAAPSGAFDSLHADRAIGVETAADEGTALLGLEASYDGQEIVYEEEGFFSSGTNISAEVATVVNNVDGDWTDINVDVASVVWSEGSDGQVLRVADAPNSLTPGNTGSIELECSGDIAGDASDALVELDVSVDGEGTTSVERDSFPITGVEFDCEGANDPGTGPSADPVPIDSVDELAVVGTPTAEPGEQFIGTPPDSRVTFEVEYSGNESATITAIQVRDTDSTATRVESILGDTTEVVIETSEDGSFDASSGINIGTSSYALDQNAVINSGAIADVTLQEFREGGEFTRVDMTGNDVTVVLTVEGIDPDSELPVKIELTDLQ